MAFQSGQTLAGLFLLRTLVEQWARLATGQLTQAASDVLDAYMESLPPDFNAHFPSLRDLYNRVSSDIHQAIGSDELFREATESVEEHFRARGLFKLLPK